MYPFSNHQCEQYLNYNNINDVCFVMLVYVKKFLLCTMLRICQCAGPPTMIVNTVGCLYKISLSHTCWNKRNSFLPQTLTYQDLL